MSDVDAGGSGRGSGGTNMILVLLVVVVLALVAWLVMRGSAGEQTDMDVNVPGNVDVEVKSSGDGK